MAVIETCARLPDSFWMMVGVVAPVFIVQLFQLIQASVNGRKATAAVKAAEGAQTAAVESRSVLAEKIDLNTQFTQKAALTKEQAELLVKGAKHENIQQGIEIERKRSSGFNALGTDTIDINTEKP